ncbi:radical SAM protein [Siccirubricoccus deserti]
MSPVAATSDACTAIHRQAPIPGRVAGRAGLRCDHRCGGARLRHAGGIGGEPMLYRPLAQILGHARRQGLATAITTNGMLLDHRRLEPLRGILSFIAVSLDGPQEAHDRMRARPGAFAAMAERLAALRDSGIPFGFLFTLTQASARHLDWVVDFAAAQGLRRCRSIR